MVASATSFSALVATAALAATVSAHGYMSDPAVKFLSSSTDNTQFIATIESSASGFSGSFSGSPADNTAAFTKAYEASSYSSLKELINAKATVTVSDATLTCGSCDPEETAQPLPDTSALLHVASVRELCAAREHHLHGGDVQVRGGDELGNQRQHYIEQHELDYFHDVGAERHYSCNHVQRGLVGSNVHFHFHFYD
ncbi:hypothetical protein ON010_g7205 [Phytophthora cinnamomi]|nr:hypothetical protein ON010_g7205 [Phytophthora cinnamomi]